MIFPQTHDVVLGSTAEFQCFGKVIGWTFNGSNLPYNAYIIAHQVLRIINVNSNNDGFYECTGNDLYYNRMVYHSRGLLLTRGIHVC